VLDYKTGAKSFDITAMYHGLQLQLPVYLGAALKYEEKKYPDKQVIPAGIFYYQVQDPLVAEEESLLKALRPDGLVNEDGRVIAHLQATLF
jgi:ATP-dependent helicase/nuclease subunit B